MVDIVIRGIADDVVAAIDAKAQRAGVSRSEYVRRVLSRERSDTEATVSVTRLEVGCSAAQRPSCVHRCGNRRSRRCRSST